MPLNNTIFSLAGFPVSAVEDLKIPMSYFGPQLQGIALVQIVCAGTEQRITDCPQLSQAILFEVFQEIFAGIRCIGKSMVSSLGAQSLKGII